MRSIKFTYIASFAIFCLFWSLPFVQAAWTPETNELAPTKDTFVSIAGSLAEPTANFGLAETLTVGKGLKGYCVSAIQFNFSALPAGMTNLTFQSDIVVYGTATRTLKISILLGEDWNQLGVTGVENPFNATELWTSETANLTTVTIGESTKQLSIDLVPYLSQTGLVTLIFASQLSDESWFTMSSLENTYLTSVSNPPRLVFTVPPPDGSGGNSGTIVAGLVVLSCIICCVVRKKKKNT